MTPAAPADLILTAGRIHTVTEDEERATAIAIRDGRIIAVGGDEVLDGFAGPDTAIHRYPDATITPGLIDSHTHIVWGAELSRGLDLTDLTLAEVRERLADAARGTPEGEWMFGWGVDPNIFDDGFDGRIFDDVTGPAPLFLRMRDAHSAIVNSATITRAGLTGAETFPDESRIDVDRDGAVTGYVLELSAMNLVMAHAPEQSFDDRVRQVREVLANMSEVGLTSTHVLDLHEGSQEILTAAEEQGELPLRLRISPFVMPGSDHDELERLAALQGEGGRRWRIEGVKFFIDGTVDNGTAWLHQPDTYGQGTDSIWTDPDAYRAALRFFAERGIATATHAIGDRGVDFVLDALEELGEIRRLAPHRIEHIETIPDSTVTRFAELGVAASMQPIHGTHHTKADRSDNWSVRLGADRAAHGWRCRDIRETGATLALGSDWPVTPFDPRAMMADSILRYPVARPGTAPVQPEQGLTALQALEGYTAHAARAVGLDHEEGIIAPGARAQLTVFAADPLSVAPETLAETPVLATYVDGAITHETAKARV